jgi:site-specific DNA-adenine methylase
LEVLRNSGVRDISDEYISQLKSRRVRQEIINDYLEAQKLAKESNLLWNLGPKLTDFYNQATKGIPEVKPEAEPISKLGYFKIEEPIATKLQIPTPATNQIKAVEATRNEFDIAKAEAIKQEMDARNSEIIGDFDRLEELKARRERLMADPFGDPAATEAFKKVRSLIGNLDFLIGKRGTDVEALLERDAHGRPKWRNGPEIYKTLEDLQSHLAYRGGGTVEQGQYSMDDMLDAYREWRTDQDSMKGLNAKIRSLEAIVKKTPILEESNPRHVAKVEKDLYGSDEWFRKLVNKSAELQKYQVSMKDLASFETYRQKLLGGSGVDIKTGQNVKPNFMLARTYSNVGTRNDQTLLKSVPMAYQDNKRGDMGYILDLLGFKNRDLSKINFFNKDHLDSVRNVVDVFGGSGLLTSLSNKLFRVASHTINDLDPKIVNYYEQIRDFPQKVKDFLVKLYVDERNRQGFQVDLQLKRIAERTSKDKKSVDILNDPSYRVAKAIYDSNRGRTGGLISPTKLDRMLSGVDNFSDTLKDTKITQQDAMKVLEDYSQTGDPSDFLWIDPPYLWSSGYRVGSELEGAAAFLKFLDRLENLNARGVKYIFFNSEPSRAGERLLRKIETASGEFGKRTPEERKVLIPDVKDQMRAIEVRLASLSANNTVIRDVRPKGGEGNRLELIITNSPWQTNLREQAKVHAEIKTTFGRQSIPESEWKIPEGVLQDLTDVIAEKKLSASEIGRAIFRATKQNKDLLGLTRSEATGVLRILKSMPKAFEKSRYSDIGIGSWIWDPEYNFKRSGTWKLIGEPLIDRGLTPYQDRMNNISLTFEKWWRVAGMKMWTPIANMIIARDMFRAANKGVDSDEFKRLTKNQQKVVMWWRAMADKYADKLDVLRRQEGLPPIDRRTNYITNLLTEAARQWVGARRGAGFMPGELMAAMDNAIPKEISLPYLMHREGGLPIKEDFFGAMRAFVAATEKKLIFDPILAEVKPRIKDLPPNLQRYTTWYINQELLGKSSQMEKIIHTSLQRIANSVFGMKKIKLPEDIAKAIGEADAVLPRVTVPTKIASKVTGLLKMDSYLFNIGLSLPTLFMNLTQPLLGMAQLKGGPWIVAKSVGYAYARALSEVFLPSRWEFWEKKGVLTQMETLNRQEFGISGLLGDVMMANMRVSEFINRVATYSMKRENIRLLGTKISADEADALARSFNDQINFKYGQGRRPQLFANPLMNLYYTFMTFPLKSAQVLLDMAGNLKIKQLLPDLYKASQNPAELRKFLLDLAVDDRGQILRYALYASVTLSALSTLGLNWWDQIFKGQVPQNLSTGFSYLIAGIQQGDQNKIYRGVFELATPAPIKGILAGQIMPGGRQYGRTKQAYVGLTTGKLPSLTTGKTIAKVDTAESLRRFFFGGMTQQAMARSQAFDAIDQLNSGYNNLRTKVYILLKSGNSSQIMPLVNAWNVKARKILDSQVFPAEQMPASARKSAIKRFTFDATDLQNLKGSAPTLENVSSLQKFFGVKSK